MIKGPPLTKEGLEEIRNRKKDPREYHDVRLAQRDRELLLQHIEWLEERVSHYQRSL